MEPTSELPQRIVFTILSSARCLEILKILSDDDHYVSSLSQHMNLSMSTMGYYLRMLNGVGLIEIRSDFNDLRYKRISLSQQGRTLVYLHENDLILPHLFKD